LRGKFEGQRPGFGRRKEFILAWLIFVLSSSLAFALEVPAGPEGRITDRTATLSRNEIAALDQKLAAFERETTNQIAVLIIPSLEGDSLEDYSIRLAEKWKIGQKGKNNGVILLVVKNERKLRIEVGYGLEGALPDALAGSIIRNEIAPRFRAGQFYQGVDAGVTAIMAATKGEYKAPKKRQQGSDVPTWLLFLLFFLFFGGFSILSFLGRKRHYHSGGSSGWTTGGGFFGGGFSGGESGGGFSGGGGDFGGGGASGDW
jgi:uncharacterized protein